MAAIPTLSGQLSALGNFARMVGQEIHAGVRRTPCQVVLGIGLANLLAGFFFQSSDWLPTFAALDVVYANFACALWLAVVYEGAQRPMTPCAVGIAAKTTALAVVAAAMLTLAGTAAVFGQISHGDAPLEWRLYAVGLYANLGLSTLHLGMLAVALRGLTGHIWLSAAATAGLWTATNVGFEHPLLRLGAPVGPASGMSGFGPFLVPQVALGIHWTGFCIVLLALGRLAARRRAAKAGGPPPDALTPNAFAFVWTAAVAWIVSGGWIYAQVDLANNGNTPRTPSPHDERPQPVYSRLDLDIVISPLERVLVSRGTAVVVNRLDEAIPELHFGIPRPMDVLALSTTGEPLGNENGCHRYLLNRPLEPKETLKIEFGLKWAAKDFALDSTSIRLLENGTFVTTAHVVPALGCSTTTHPFRSAPPVAFRARIGTSLDQVAVTAGVLVRAWKENGWSFFEYESRESISPFTTIHAGHYAIRRIAAQVGSIEVYHHPPHEGRVDHMIEVGRAALSHRLVRAPTTQPVVKVVEVPEYRLFRRPGFLGFGQDRAYVDVRPGMVLPYSERGYPLSTPPPSESIPPRA